MQNPFFSKSVALGRLSVGPLAVSALCFGLCLLSPASEAQSPTATPAGGATPTPTGGATPTGATPTPTGATPTPTGNPTPTPTGNPTPTPTGNPTPTPTGNPTPTPTGEPTPTSPPPTDPSPPNPSPNPTPTKQDGQWKVSYEIAGGTGSGSHTQNYNIASKMFSTGEFARDLKTGQSPEGKEPSQRGSAYTYGNGSGIGGSSWALGMGGQASAKIEGGSVEVIYKWGPADGVPADAQLKDPDPKFSFIVESTASAQITAPPGTATPKLSASIGGKSDSSEETGYLSVLSKKLYSFDTKGQREFKVTMSGDAEASIGDSKDYTDRNVAASFFVGSKIDNRWALLSRVGAHDEWVDGDTTHGDTTYSYFLQTTPYENTQHFTVGFSGDWTEREFSYNDLQWTAKGTSNEWSPASDIDKGQNFWKSASYNIPFGSPKLWGWGWQGPPTGQSEKAITYTVKDNRNNEGEVTAEAKYVLHIHDPLELSWETEDSVSVNVVLYGDNGQPIQTPDAPNGLQAGSYNITAGTSSSQGWTAGGSVDAEKINKYLKFLKLDFKYGVTNAQSVALSAQLGFDLLPGEKAYAMATHYYTRHHKYVYMYDIGGRQVRMGRGALDAHEDPNELKEVPHEIFADEGPGTPAPFWAGPIRNTEVPPTTSTTPPPFQSTYTS